MYNLAQINLFENMENENIGDLQKLRDVFNNVNDDDFCKKLEAKRKNGRNDFPIRVMLNLIYAMKIFGHRSIASFIRELKRNSQLRKACGLNDSEYEYGWSRKSLVPAQRVFTGILKKIAKYQDEFDKVFENLVKEMYDIFPNFGVNCAIDGKFLDTYAQKFRKERTQDNRAEHDAESSCKTYYYEDGRTKSEWHYGFRIHLMCDASYGLPIEYRMTPANNSEQKECDNMLDELSEGEKSYKLEVMKNLMADAGYDSGIRNKRLKQEFDINPIVDIRSMWKEEKIREINNQMLAYNEKGEVFLILESGEYEKLKYAGYDKANNALRYERAEKGKKIYRVPLETDYRIFVPVARDSKKFEKLYKTRTEVERLNGRIDRDYMFNDHFIRGLKKMKLMVSLSFVVMLSLAKAHAKRQEKNIRSLVA